MARWESSVCSSELLLDAFDQVKRAEGELVVTVCAAALLREPPGELERLLLPEDQSRWREIGDLEARAHLVSGRVLMRFLTSQIAGCAPQEVRLAVGLFGKPLVEMAGATLGVSLSHAGDIVACAVSARGSIGVDIEPFPPRDHFRTSCSEPRADHRWHTSDWTRREACLKALGFGLRFSPENLTFREDERGVGVSVNGCEDMAVVADLSLPGLVGSLCLLRPIGEVSEFGSPRVVQCDIRELAQAGFPFVT